MPTACREVARAKINLALHVTGRRADGYHLLDSLVAFAADGDRLSFERADTDRFTIDGAFGQALNPDDTSNLVLRARDGLRQAINQTGGQSFPVSIHLTKALPIASGIGGGSADAAATLRGLSKLWNVSLPDAQLSELGVSLGADVPMCLLSRACVARGIGEELTPLSLPSLPLVLVNPMVPVSTPEVFRRLEKRDNPPMQLPHVTDAADWPATIAGLRNDLEPAARQIAPSIGEACALLSAAGATVARMSGSGATCFGIFNTESEAMRAAESLVQQKPGWYVQATMTTAGGYP
jgi:4-diphosphocytidyl-2-C-methyl-D-erythritol kinase